MKKFLDQYSISLAVVGFLCVIVPLAFFGIRYFLAEIDSDIETLQTKKIDQEVQLNFLQQSEALVKQRETLEESGAQVEVLLTENDDSVIALYSEIEDLSRESQNSSIELRVDQYKGLVTPPKKSGTAPVRDEAKEIEEPEKVAPVKVAFGVEPVSDKFLYLHITTIGTYNNFLEFVNKLENMRYFSDILSLTVIEHDTGNLTRDGEIGEGVDGRTNLVAGDLYIGFYLSGGSARAEELEDPTAGLDSVDFLK